MTHAHLCGPCRLHLVWRLTRRLRVLKALRNAAFLPAHGQLGAASLRTRSSTSAAHSVRSVEQGDNRVLPGTQRIKRIKPAGSVKDDRGHSKRPPGQYASLATPQPTLRPTLAGKTVLDRVIAAAPDRTDLQGPAPGRDIAPQEPLQSVEDDFLDRITAGRSNLQGPYSSPRPRETRHRTLSNAGMPPNFFRAGLGPDGRPTSLAQGYVSPSPVTLPLRSGLISLERPGKAERNRPPVVSKHRRTTVAVDSTGHTTEANAYVMVRNAPSAPSGTARKRSSEGSDVSDTNNRHGDVSSAAAAAESVHSTPHGEHTNRHEEAVVDSSSHLAMPNDDVVARDTPDAPSGTTKKRSHGRRHSFGVKDGGESTTVAATEYMHVESFNDMEINVTGTSSQALGWKAASSSAVPDAQIHALNQSKRASVIMSLDTSIADSWVAFLAYTRSDNLAPSASKHLQDFNALSESHHLREFHSSLVRKFEQAWCKGRLGSFILTPSQLMRRLRHQTGTLSYSLLGQLMIRILEPGFARMEGQINDPDSPTIADVERELLKLWDFVFELCADPEVMATKFGSTKEMSLWEAAIELPEVGTSLLRKNMTETFDATLNDIFPMWHDGFWNMWQYRVPMNLVLVATYVFLQRLNAYSRATKTSKKADDLIRFVRAMFRSTNTERFALARTWDTFHFGYAGVVISDMRALERRRQGSLAEDLIPHDAHSQPTLTTLEIDLMLTRRILDARLAQDAPKLHEAFDFLTDDSSSGFGKRLTNPFAAYSELIWGYLQLKRPKDAIRVWNHMIQAGLTADDRLWAKMMRGFAILRDARGVAQIWSMLLDSGCQPGARLWSWRIYSLSVAGDYRAAVLAFDEMLMRWLRAAKKERPRDSRERLDLASMGDLPDAPKPNKLDLNTVLRGMSKRARREEAMGVLSRGIAIGIQPDAYSFNALIKNALEEEDFDGVDEMLSQMQKHNVQPDVATFTMMIEGIFSQDTERQAQEFLSMEEQIEKKQEDAMAMFNSLQGFGLKATGQTFSTMINGLLKTGDDASLGPSQANFDAARSILRLMQKASVPASTEIYTAFITAYFAKKPHPDVPAIDAVWKQAREDNAKPRDDIGKVRLDNIFYDRLVEGFAECGQLSRMKMALAQAAAHNFNPGWMALTKMLRALADAGDMVGAEELVHNVRQEERTPTAVRPRKGKAWFIRTCEELGYDVHDISQDPFDKREYERSPLRSHQTFDAPETSYYRRR